MAITDKLKSLYTKLGGDANTSASNIEEWVNKIEEVAGSGAGGSGCLILEMVEKDAGGTPTIEMPSNELFDAVMSGRDVKIEQTHRDETYGSTVSRLSFSRAYSRIEPSGTYYEFVFIGHNTGDIDHIDTLAIVFSGMDSMYPQTGK